MINTVKTYAEKLYVVHDNLDKIQIHLMEIEKNLRSTAIYDI